VKLRAVDRTGTVLVEVFEDTLPILDVFPQSSELRRERKRPGDGFEGLRRTSLNPMVPLRSESNMLIRSLTVSRSNAARNPGERPIGMHMNRETYDSNLR